MHLLGKAAVKQWLETAPDPNAEEMRLLIASIESDVFGTLYDLGTVYQVTSHPDGTLTIRLPSGSALVVDIDFTEGICVVASIR